jgi:hypothetical protein
MSKSKKRAAHAKTELGLPKKAAASIAAMTIGGIQQKPPVELGRFLLNLRRHVGRERIADLTRVIAPLTHRGRKKLHPKAPAAESFALAANAFDAVLRESNTFSATVPIVLHRFNSAQRELIGSGVLLRIVNRTFLVTAAHVTDRRDDGLLCIPAKDQFMQITGSFASMRIPESGRRTDDRLDVAYYCLDDDCARNLNSECCILERGDVFLEGEPNYYTNYTFTGYPWRQSSVTHDRVVTAFNTITGLEVHANEYAALGLSRSRHIAIHYRRRRVFSAKNRKTFMGALPHGMSGGGVYIWSEEALRERKPCLPLAGIATEYHPERGLLVATRLHVFVRCIFHNQPDLAALASR